MHFPLSFCKNASPTFSTVHLLHRLYGVDALAVGPYVALRSGKALVYDIYSIVRDRNSGNYGF